MFTGIIEGLGEIKRKTPFSKGIRIAIEPSFLLKDPQVGESISVNGVCLTATKIDEHFFEADISPETLSRTTLGKLKIGEKVNLERALCLGSRLGGHLVSGHIDCVGQIREKKDLGDFLLFKITIPQKFSKYVIEKGSVAIDGISLTVNSCSLDEFSVAIIPHTASITTMGFREIGDKVNIEFDVIGKYIEKLLQQGNREITNTEKSNTIDLEFLAKHGFL